MTDLAFWLTLVAGMYLIIIGVIIQTPNLLFAVFFKAIPVILGAFILIGPLKTLSLI